MDLICAPKPPDTRARPGVAWAATAFGGARPGAVPVAERTHHVSCGKPPTASRCPGRVFLQEARSNPRRPSGARILARALPGSEARPAAQGGACARSNVLETLVPSIVALPPEEYNGAV